MCWLLFFHKACKIELPLRTNINHVPTSLVFKTDLNRVKEKHDEFLPHFEGTQFRFCSPSGLGSGDTSVMKAIRTLREYQSGHRSKNHCVRVESIHVAESGRTGSNCPHIGMGKDNPGTTAHF